MKSTETTKCFVHTSTEILGNMFEFQIVVFNIFSRIGLFNLYETQLVYDSFVYMFDIQNRFKICRKYLLNGNNTYMLYT